MRLLTRILALLCIVASIPTAALKLPWFLPTVSILVAAYGERDIQGTESYAEGRHDRFVRAHVAVLLYVLGFASLVGLGILVANPADARWPPLFWALAAVTGFSIAWFEDRSIGPATDRAYVVIAQLLPLLIGAVSSVGLGISLALRRTRTA